MKIPYEILIRGNNDGTLSGCHVIDVVGGDAKPITQEDLALIAPSINASAIAQVESIKRELDSINKFYLGEIEKIQADLNSKNELIDSAKNGIKSAIANEELNPEATVLAIAEIVAVAEMPSIEKRKADLAAEIQAKQAELESLT